MYYREKKTLAYYSIELNGKRFIVKANILRLLGPVL
jgi:hypothetical protein